MEDELTTTGEFVGSREQDLGAGLIRFVRLEHLQAKGLIDKSRDKKNHHSFFYELTEKGTILSQLLSG